VTRGYTSIDHPGHDTSEHRSAGLSWKPVIADTTLTVRTVQLQSRGSTPLSTGPMIHLHIQNGASLNPDGKDIAAGTDLSPEDAEMLAATLVCEAKRVRALHSQRRRQHSDRHYAKTSAPRSSPAPPTSGSRS
jgi:hypothetical protein